MVNVLPTLISYMIKGGLEAYAFISKPFEMQPSTLPFVTLLRHSTRNDTASFVNTHFHDAQCTSELLHNLQSQFIVRVISVNKANTIIKHESLGVWIIDKDTGRQHTFTIDRTPSSHSHAATFKFFSESSESEEILESIWKAIKTMWSMTGEAITKALESLSAMMLPTDESDSNTKSSIPLLPLLDDTSSEGFTLPHLFL